MEEAQVWSAGMRKDKDTAGEMGVVVVARGLETGWSRVQGWKSQSGGDAFMPQRLLSIHKGPSREEGFQRHKDW